jgi:amidase
MNELIRLSAREAVAKLKAGEVSPLEMIDAAAARIEEVEPDLNALPTLCLERARDRAKALMAEKTSERNANYLYGLPIAVKDLNCVEGVRTTMGSPIFADNIPDYSDYMVRKLEENGALVIAKANTPEFGAGANTFNEVFGRTCNPWGVKKNPGGSSGGSAVALAAGEVWLATGSDLGGSLRIPASYCSVVGLRPTPGRVTSGPSPLPFAAMGVEGPMGRNVGDVALMLDAQSGPHIGDPISIPAAIPGSFLQATINPVMPTRMGYSRDFGIVPVDDETADLCAAAMKVFSGLGVTVDDACPDLSTAFETFEYLRAAGFSAGKEPMLHQYRDQLKPEVIWNIERGLELKAADIGRAERERAAMYASAAKFFETHDFFASPCVVTAPFDGEIRYLEEINGHKFGNYIDWLVMTFAVTLLGCPAISVPCGFTSEGLPVGLQIVGPPHSEARLLAASRLFEEASGLDALVPMNPKQVPSPVVSG